MLEPDSRVVLMDQLRPPVGYRLAGAVATTFTLHLSTALVPPLAFASHEMRTRPDPISALQAVRSCAERVDIFCQAGQIAVPATASDLMAFLEPMIHPVVRPRPGSLFHPKIWFLRYITDGGQDVYRLLCSTRNLVDSAAWDAVVSLDGVLTDEGQAVNEPLAAFLRQLPDWAVTALPAERRDRIDDLAERAARVLWTPPENVSSVMFHALGVPGVTPSLDFSGYRHLVVSPFCNVEGVGRVTAGNTRDVALVSRVEELDRLDADFLAQVRRPGDEAVFALDPLAGLGMALEQETDGASATGAPATSELTGLHAKVIVAERNRGETHAFVGSANATSAAFGGNVEFVVELVGRSQRLGVETLMRRGEGRDPTFRDLLQPYRRGESVLPEDDEALRELENVLRTLAAVACRVAVETGEDGYTLHLTSENVFNVPPGHTVILGILTRPGLSVSLTGASTVDVRFGGVPLPDVTPFVTLRVTDGMGLTLSTVIHAPLANDPPGRLDEVLARQVDTREKFIRFLALLLGLGDQSALAVTGTAVDAGGWITGLPGRSGIFELVLAALADRPESLVDLDRLVTRLQTTEAGRGILPDGFDAFWSTVIQALAIRKELS